MMDHLIDIGIDIVEHRAQIKACGGEISDKKVECSRLRRHISTTFRQLNEWWRRWELDCGSLVAVVYHTAADEPPFPTLLKYKNLWTAFTVCVYDAIRILLLQLWQPFQHFLSSSEPIDESFLLETPNRTGLLGITTDIKGLAREILRSLNYCYEKSRRFIYTFSFLFIQDVAYGCFEPGSKEALWAAGHVWAESARYEDTEDANILRNLLPLGQIKAEEDGQDVKETIDASG